MASRRLISSKDTFSDGTIMEMVAWELPAAVPGSTHRYKYRFFFGRPGERLIGYDNERGKGDHRHLGTAERRYEFKGLERLILDFRDDVDQWRKANPHPDRIG